MADTRGDITIPTGAWLNLYTASGVTLGAAATITNKSSSPCYIVIAASAPTITAVPKGLPLFAGSESNMCSVPSGASGLWGFAPNNAATLLVQD
jgi:hypothetical protein